MICLNQIFINKKIFIIIIISFKDFVKFELKTYIYLLKKGLNLTLSYMLKL